jgi:hypothetical protein
VLPRLRYKEIREREDIAAWKLAASRILLIAVEVASITYEMAG